MNITYSFSSFFKFETFKLIIYETSLKLQEWMYKWLIDKIKNTENIKMYGKSN